LYYCLNNLRTDENHDTNLANIELEIDWIIWEVIDNKYYLRFEPNPVKR
jgi:hypothetical protein